LRYVFLLLISIAFCSFAGGYDRKDFNYHSYEASTSIGFYTEKSCDFIIIDHMVSLKDAYESGAIYWDASKKETFANDRSNHVPSCSRVNSSKGAAGPSDFLRRSNNGKGFEYKIVRFCDYVQRYYEVKVRYRLSFKANDIHPIVSCGITQI
jgi:hypothetical protein